MSEKDSNAVGDGSAESSPDSTEDTGDAATSDGAGVELTPKQIIANAEKLAAKVKRDTIIAGYKVGKKEPHAVRNVFNHVDVPDLGLPKKVFKPGDILYLTPNQAKALKSRISQKIASEAVLNAKGKNRAVYK